MFNIKKEKKAERVPKHVNDISLCYSDIAINSSAKGEQYLEHGQSGRSDTMYDMTERKCD